MVTLYFYMLFSPLSFYEMASMFQYSKAICRKIPKSLVTQALRMDETHKPIVYDKACEEHDKYVETLKNLGLEVILLEADEALPDCVFVEDVAVICKDKALITNPGHRSRQGETLLMKKALEDLEIRVRVMKDPAKMDGGDVLFTGKEFFVGLSSRTNKKGIEVLNEVFPDYPVHGIEVVDATLHLKSMMSLVGEGIIAISNSKSANQAMHEIQSKAKFQYKMLKVSTDAAANCLLINDHVIHRSSFEYPGIIDEFSSLPAEKLELSNSELSKVDGALTCCSLLIN